MKSLIEKNPYRPPPELTTLEGTTHLFQLHFDPDNTRKSKIYPWYNLGRLGWQTTTNNWSWNNYGRSPGKCDNDEYATTRKHSNGGNTNNNPTTRTHRMARDFNSSTTNEQTKRPSSHKELFTDKKDDAGNAKSKRMKQQDKCWTNISNLS